MIGQTISHYKILEKLGGGGMGIVYKAEDTKLDRLVALKFLPAGFGTDEEQKQRFIHEAKAASALDHNNICTIHEIDETDDGQMFIVMAYYDGETLKKKVERGNMKVDEATDIAIQVAEGLTQAHLKDIIHRDIKPANILVTDKGVVKIVDFGLAKLAGQTKLTKASTTLGTTAYMSPEQARGEEVDHRTDIWSLGVVIYEMLTGQVPFKGDFEQSVVYSILNEEAEPVTGLRTGVPKELERIVNKALVKTPPERYQHVDEMVVDLKSIRKQIETGKSKQQPTETTSTKKRPIYLYAGFAVFLTLVVLAGIYFWPEPDQPINSIAVLPLDNLSGDSEQDYFVDGMTEVLITELSKIEALSVPSRTSAMRYKNTDKSLTEIAEELQVGALVEGSAMLVGDRIRITAQLIEAQTDRHLWAEDYERDFRDVLSLQKEVARAIAREIQIQVTPQDEALLGEAQPVDPEAYELYLRGRHLLNRGKDRVRAVEYLEQAVTKDPDYAPAFADMVLPYVLLGLVDSLSMDEAEPKARRAAKRALELNNMLPEAHVAMGLVREFFDWDWTGAERSFSRAIQMNPRSRDAHMEYGWLLMRTGRFEEALAEIEMQRTLEQDPLSIMPHLGFSWVYYYRREYDLAIEHSWAALQLNPNDWLSYRMLGLAYIQKGKYEDAQAFLQKAIELKLANRDTPAQAEVGYLGLAYAVSGQREEAMKLLNDLQARWRLGDDSAFGIAAIFIGLGEKEKALAWLERASKSRHGTIVSLKVNPIFDDLRSDPRFKVLLKKMNLE